MKSFAVAAAAALGIAGSIAAQADVPLRGFTPPGAAAERALEARFSDTPSASEALATLADLEAQPHAAGSWGDRELARSVGDAWRAAGLVVRAIPYDAPIVTARRLTLELSDAAPSAPARGHHRHPHRAHARDLVAAERRAGLLPLDPASPDGDASGLAVVAQTGSARDIARLTGADATIRDAVVVVPSASEAHAAVAARLAAEGALGAVFAGTPDPAPPIRPMTGIPFITLAPGSMAALLQAIDEAGLGARLHLAVVRSTHNAALADVAARIDGTADPRPIVVFARRDARATADPSAGTATLVEIGRSLGSLVAGGWQPRRTIVLLSTDGGDAADGARAFVRHDRAAQTAGIVGALDAREPASGGDLVPLTSPALAATLMECAGEVANPERPAAALTAVVRARAPIAARVAAIVPAADGDFAGAPLARPILRGPAGLPNPVFVRSAAQLTGTLALRLADADVVPYAFAGYLPQLRSLDAYVAARSAALRVRADVRPLRAATAAFAAASRHYDRLAALPGAPGNGRGAPDPVDAARIVESLTGGGDGLAGPVDAIEAAFTARDANAVDTALARTAATLSRAAADLGGG